MRVYSSRVKEARAHREAMKKPTMRRAITLDLDVVGYIDDIAAHNGSNFSVVAASMLTAIMNDDRQVEAGRMVTNNG